jgi:hypothetical protein
MTSSRVNQWEPVSGNRSILVSLGMFDETRKIVMLQWMSISQKNEAQLWGMKSRKS